MTARWRPWRRFTTDQMIIGGLVAIGVSQLILLGLTGQGSPSMSIPESWIHRRDQ